MLAFKVDIDYRSDFGVNLFVFRLRKSMAGWPFVEKWREKVHRKEYTDTLKICLVGHGRRKCEYVGVT